MTDFSTIDTPTPERTPPSTAMVKRKDGLTARAENIGERIDSLANKLRDFRDKVNGVNVTDLATGAPIAQRKGLPGVLETAERRLSDAEKMLTEIDSMFNG
jgi:hypothetical protein